MAAPIVVILAAGQGTRMRSAVPKVLHEICGRPMIAWPLQAARDAGAGKVVVVASPGGALEGALPGDVTVAVQAEPRGTGDAVRAAAAHINGDAPVVVLSADVPLITAQAIRDLVAAHIAAGVAATMATMELDDPGSYGRVVRGPDGGVEHVAEAKTAGDATAAELEIREVNAGIYVFDGVRLVDALERIAPDNAQGEYYLPDVLKVLRGDDHGVATHPIADPQIVLGINDRVDLANVRAIAQRRILEEHMRAGVTIVDPVTTLVDAGVTIGQDTEIEPGTYLRGATAIGARCRVGPATTFIDMTLGDEVTVRHSYCVESEVRDGASVGPFAYLRPGTVVRERAKIGTFVEVKNSDVGEGAKVPHLSYLGDADVGEGSN
ncbi:MAG: bifunctional UDP-N-acetylglucosamine diphosphorylase/glucosamine-1-phosphate N-acetyltransferase GlmU, partial [Actinomycetota bacterium]|nr:bifunctional UDP-N-acetylglucosamine diphosphorylase/glucosamine-1-phosphate N-acetyltransferase GlmU [Actinomycetota bacterium]